MNPLSKTVISGFIGGTIYALIYLSPETLGRFSVIITLATLVSLISSYIILGKSVTQNQKLPLLLIIAGGVVAFLVTAFETASNPMARDPSILIYLGPAMLGISISFLLDKFSQRQKKT